MNLLPTLSRACAHQNLPLRPLFTRPLQASQRQTQRPQPQERARKLTTTSSQSHAQPIELTSQTATPTTPPSPATLTSSTSILARAPTDPTTPTATKSQSTPTSTQPKDPQPSTKPPLSTTSPFLRLATVTRVGTMQSTIQLTSQTQTFDRFLQKHYTRPHRLLAHDPFPPKYLREGDVVEYGLFSEAERDAAEQKRLTLERNLLAKGVIRLRTRKGKERKLRDVGVKRRGPRWVVRRVVGAWGVGVEER